jgi:hypothetical protein
MEPHLPPSFFAAQAAQADYREAADALNRAIAGLGGPSQLPRGETVVGYGEYTAEMALRNPRALLSPSGLYALLSEEFQQKRPPGCESCKMPLPFRVDPPDDVSANWRVGTAPECSHACQAVIAEIVARMWPLFDLRD